MTETPIFTTNPIMEMVLQSANEIFPNHYGSIQDWKMVIEARQQFSPQHRDILVQHLRDNNPSPHPKIEAQIQKLSLTTSRVIVTGQQAGIGGGPVYTLFKTLKAIHQCEVLAKQFPEYNFIPVFWLEVEDHDFKEIDEVYFPEQSAFISNDSDVNDFTQIHFRTIPNSFEVFLEKLKAASPTSEFSETVWIDFSSCYQPGISFGDAFYRWLNKCFESYGLLILHPSDPNLKKLFLPLVEKEIKEQFIKKSVDQDIEKLEEKNISIQAQPRDVNVFFVYENQRKAIRVENNLITIEQTPLQFSLPQFLDHIQQHPETLSPNVLSRPLYQDTILPTVGVVVGPGEISYFAELITTYKQNGIPFPILIPRFFGCILEPHIDRLLDKYGKPISYFLTNEDIISHILMEKSGISIPDLERHIKENLNLIMEEKTSIIQQLDPTLVDTWKSTIGKVHYGNEQFFQRLEKSLKKQEELTVTQIKKIQHHVYPEGKLQERKVSFLYYILKYGYGLIDHIYQFMNTTEKFQLIHLKNKSEH